ncbi:MAG: nitronate monooxygenase [bacterium]|nr:nitronate monooxygenase [bacterium]
MSLIGKLSQPVFIDGAWIRPLIQGGKGVGATNGVNAGAWAMENAGGTIAAIGAAIGYDKKNRELPYSYRTLTRHERFEEMISQSVEGCKLQVEKAFETSDGKGRIRLNFLKMAGGSMRIMREVLATTRLPNGGNKVHAVTMGAGLASEEDAKICADEGVYLDPIISSLMALKVLLKRTYRNWSGRYHEVIGAVVYEDPWLAGGHNGITSRENPDEPQDPYERVKGLRKIMNDNGMSEVAIIMAGGVWHLREWESWLDNPDIGPVAFQIGTRDLLTIESPISDEWKDLMLEMKEGDVVLNKFSPTGFYSSAYKNAMMRELYERSSRQVPYAKRRDTSMSEPVEGPGVPNNKYGVTPQDMEKVNDWIEQGFTMPLRTPDDTLVFVTPEKALEIKSHKDECVGCISTCKLSTWSEEADKKHSTGKMSDPRVHCIRKGLQGAIHGTDLDKYLIFAGHNAYRAGEDPFYRNEDGSVFIPTVKQLIERLTAGS